MNHDGDLECDLGAAAAVADFAEKAGTDLTGVGDSETLARARVVF